VLEVELVVRDLLILREQETLRTLKVPEQISLLIFVEVFERGPLLWSRGQSSLLQIQRSRVRFPALPGFLRSRGSGTGFTQSRGDK
jgi:hypothetical protein